MLNIQHVDFHNLLKKKKVKDVKVDQVIKARLESAGIFSKQKSSVLSNDALELCRHVAGL